MIQVKFNDKAKQVLADTLDLGGSKVVTELPQVGEEHTIYELQETKVADFPWLLTEIDSSNGYPKWGAPTIVVGTEEDVNPDNLAMEGIPYGQKNAIGVYVTSTNKLYTCWKEAAESGPDVFNQIEQTPVNNIYVFGKSQLAILRDFDYHVTGAEESDILDGTGHFLDGTEFDYNYHRGVIPLVLTDVTDKKILLNPGLIGVEEVTSETPLENPVQVNKIDLSLGTYFDEDKEVIFAPQPSKTISTYWIYTNDEWVNVDEIGNLNTITIPIRSINHSTLIPLNKVHFYLDNKELELVTVQSQDPESEDCGYLVVPLLGSAAATYQLHIVFDNDISIGTDCTFTNYPTFVEIEDNPHIQIIRGTQEYDFELYVGYLWLTNSETE